MRPHFTGAATGVALVATLAVPALTTAPAHADDRTGTTLSIRTVRSAVAPGGSTAVTGVLLVKGLGGSAGHPVTLEAKPLGTEGFVPVAETTTGDHGGVRVEVTPETTTRYRWHYAGDDTTRPSVSGIARVRGAHARAPADPPQHHADHPRRPARGAPDGQAVVRGRLAVRRVPVQHRWVVLLSRTDGAEGWAFGDVRAPVPTAGSPSRSDRTSGRRTAWSSSVRRCCSPSAAPSSTWLSGRPSPSPRTRRSSTPGARRPSAARSHHAPARSPARRSSCSPAGSARGSPSRSSAPAPPPRTAPSRSPRRRCARSSTGCACCAPRACPRAISQRVRVDVRFATSLSIRGRATTDGVRRQRRAPRPPRDPARP